MSKNTIDLPESLTIHRIEEVFGDLKVSFSSEGDNVKLNADKVDTVDTSGLQLLLRFILDADKNGKSISWNNPSETLVSAAKQVGLDSALKLS